MSAESVGAVRGVAAGARATLPCPGAEDPEAEFAIRMGPRAGFGLGDGLGEGWRLGLLLGVAAAVLVGGAVVAVGAEVGDGAGALTVNVPQAVTAGPAGPTAEAGAVYEPHTSWAAVVTPLGATDDSTAWQPSSVWVSGCAGPSTSRPSQVNETAPLGQGTAASGAKV